MGIVIDFLRQHANYLEKTCTSYDGQQYLKEFNAAIDAVDCAEQACINIYKFPTTDLPAAIQYASDVGKFLANIKK